MQAYETPEQFRSEPEMDDDALFVAEQAWRAEHDRRGGLTLGPLEVIEMEERQVA